jgi:hypothetical protein
MAAPAFIAARLKPPILDWGLWQFTGARNVGDGPDILVTLAPTADAYVHPSVDLNAEYFLTDIFNWTTPAQYERMLSCSDGAALKSLSRCVRVTENRKAVACARQRHNPTDMRARELCLPADYVRAVELLSTWKYLRLQLRAEDAPVVFGPGQRRVPRFMRQEAFLNAMPQDMRPPDFAQQVAALLANEQSVIRLYDYYAQITNELANSTYIRRFVPFGSFLAQCLNLEITAADMMQKLAPVT